MKTQFSSTGGAEGGDVTIEPKTSSEIAADQIICGKRCWVHALNNLEGIMNVAPEKFIKNIADRNNPPFLNV